MAEKKVKTEEVQTEEQEERKLCINPKDLPFDEKIIEIQCRLNAPKSRYNKFGDFHYRSLEDVLEALKPLLRLYGVMLIINDEIVQIGERYYVKATATLHGENGGMRSATAYAREAASKPKMDESQITGSASSYARKYALNGLLCIDDTKDADTEEQKMQTERKAEPRALTKEEVEAIEKACAEKEGRKEAVLEWAKVDSFERMTVTQYKQAMERFGK